jgi:Flp pilus assembly pilin Flp
MRLATDLRWYPMQRLIIRLMRVECGQDMVEYALLAAFIGTVGILTWQSIGTGIGSKYLGWDSGVQGLYSPPDPGAGS